MMCNMYCSLSMPSNVIYPSSILDPDHYKRKLLCFDGYTECISSFILHALKSLNKCDRAQHSFKSQLNNDSRACTCMHVQTCACMHTLTHAEHLHACANMRDVRVRVHSMRDVRVRVCMCLCSCVC